MLSVGQFLVASLLVTLILLVIAASVALYLYLRKHNREQTAQMVEFADILTRHAELLATIIDQQTTTLAVSNNKNPASVLRSDEDERLFQRDLESRARSLGAFAKVP